MLPPGNPLLFYGGVALCLAAVGRVALDVAGYWRGRQAQRRQSDADAEAFRAEVAIAAESARARLAKQLAWEGRRTLQVAAVVDESPDAKSLYLTDPGGRPLPGFLPGQYLTLSLPAGPGGAEVVRCYSLSDRPRAEYYRLTIRRQGPPKNEPDAPAGVASNWLHQHAREGLEIACEAPKGAFFYNPRERRPAVLIGAGVGVTPLVSMLASLNPTENDPPTFAFFGFRDGESHLFADSVREIADEQPSITTFVAYSQPLPEDVCGVDYDVEGRLSLEVIQHALPSNKYEFFLCGPADMMQTLVPELLDWGVPETAIHYEAFGPASVNTKGGASLAEKALGSTVRFTPDGEALVWDGSHDSLLDLAEAAGAPIASGCRAGNCGACRVRVAEGSVATLKRPGATVEEGECLACISLPIGPVSIEA